jgi:divalent metal cation (Fe/Co/Zn/Cd) transporter
MNIPHTISEEESSSPNSADGKPPPRLTSRSPTGKPTNATNDYVPSVPVVKKIKRTPKALYKVPDESTPLIGDPAATTTNATTAVSSSSYPSSPPHPPPPPVPPFQFENPTENNSREDSNSRVVTIAIYINLAANTILLAGKIAVMVLTSSLSILASLVDAALDFLSTGIVWTTTTLISRRDQYTYPVGRRRLEPIGVLVFSVIMITSFFQVSLQCLQHLTSSSSNDGKKPEIVQLTLPSILIMLTTILLKLLCYLYCRTIPNTSVQALSQDAQTDIIFNTFSLIFPALGSAFQIWSLDALGGLLLSLYVIINWSYTSTRHIRNLTGAVASPTDRNILLYLTMRFADSIKQIQALQAYHAGDGLIVEVDVVLADEGMQLRDSHDLGESLQYLLESVPVVDRAFVHLDYRSSNLPSHMVQMEEG